MRKLVLIVTILVVGWGSVYAQDLQPLVGDFHALMLDIGRSVAPSLQSMAISGNSIGEASIDHFTFQLLGLGLTTFDGIAKILHDDTYEWKFVLPLSSLISDAIGTSGTTKDLYDMSGKTFGLPSIQFALGFPVGWGFELIGSGLWIPQTAVDWGITTFGGMLGSQTAALLDGLNPELSILNAGIKLRKVFIKDAGFVPAVSASAGFVYSDFHIGAAIPSLVAILGKPIVITGVGNLEAVVDNLDVTTKTMSFGLEFNLSKRLFVLTPFARLAAWYQSSSYESNVSMNATLTDEATSTSLQQSISSYVPLSFADLSLYTTLGCDLNILGFVLSPSLTLDLENTIIDIQSFSLSGFILNGVMVNLGLRLSY